MTEDDATMILPTVSGGAANGSGDDTAVFARVAGGGPAEPVRALIELDGVGMTYPGPPPVEALKPVELRIDDGEYVAIVGPSGSGKSTLLNLLGLLDAPTAGTYWLDGHDTSKMKEAHRTQLRADKIGFIFQAFHLMAHRTATENVAMSLVYQGVPKRKRRQIAREKLELVGLSHRLDALPTTLSGGERQRVAIARALAAGPSLLLCDEPTGNLDSKTADSIMATLDELHAEGLTILIITHDHEVAERAQRAVTIRDGQLREGNHLHDDGHHTVPTDRVAPGTLVMPKAN
ncbi:putative ABC transport system ATP-binding protein [Glycomyces algeriensis]|uniref:ABC transporter ATP-binding protein n=2 Tax=Glycomyces algeriensis TaxID=256037 RepID=A0A9W6G5H0_9ACTN|nr:ABC transporter ATP-binding protein [Glycomyces algeriensis]MDA1368499.1 ABC transporter ATP-binding protein [Glycomyces algeriensis]MDR7348762.1 putative ABC transport system ATP-binding protein [Glycomyces algeriensis]GLI41464.1 ABC transporter ATP-binding protein [Glycomyces algeriensis]